MVEKETAAAAVAAAVRDEFDKKIAAAERELEEAAKRHEAAGKRVHDFIARNMERTTAAHAQDAVPMGTFGNPYHKRGYRIPC